VDDLQEEEVLEHLDLNLTGVYEDVFMRRGGLVPYGPYKAWVKNIEEALKQEWTAAEVLDVHERRLRGPWGRPYVRELARLRDLLNLLDTPMPDLQAHKHAIQQRKQNYVYLIP
jgi:hypothetical protein